MEAKLLQKLSQGSHILRESGINQKLWIVTDETKTRANYIAFSKLLSKGHIEKTIDRYPKAKYSITELGKSKAL